MKRNHNYSGHKLGSSFNFFFFSSHSLTRVLSEGGGGGGFSGGGGKDTFKLEQSRFCHECGTQYPVAVAKFCCYCGMRRIAI